MASVTSEFQKREESSVFVGNIPNFEPEAKLREEMPVVLGQFGQVVDFHLHRKQYKGVGGKYPFTPSLTLLSLTLYRSHCLQYLCVRPIQHSERGCCGC